MRRIRLALIIAIAGCGGPGYPQTGSAPQEPPGTPSDYEQRIERMRGELSAALGDVVTGDLVRPDGESIGQQPTRRAQRVPDCGAAADLRDRICELAGRICAIAEREPSDGDVKQKCEASSGTCERARADVARICGA